MREEKKYEILPGVEIPDIKKIQEAASDFSISEVGDVEIRTVTFQPVIEPIAPGVSAEECGNYRDHDLKGAKEEAAKMYEVLFDWTADKLAYPKK